MSLYALQTLSTHEAPLISLKICEDVTDSPEKEKIHKKALEIFQQPFQNLYDKANSWIGLQIATVYATGIIGSVTSAALLVLGINNDYTFTIIGSSFGLALFPATLRYGMPYLINKQQLANFYVDHFNLMAGLKITFKDFKETPEDSKVTLLFNLYLALFEAEHLANNEQILWFKSTGKIFLMEKLMQILEKHNDKSPLVISWNQTKKMVLVGKPEEPPETPWCDIDVESPCHNAYLEFQEQMKEPFLIDIINEIENFLKDLQRFPLSIFSERIKF